MKISLFVVGKTSFPYIQQGIEDYSKRLGRWVEFEIFILKDSKLQYAELIKKQEAEFLNAKIQEQDYVILLDEKGKKFNSIKFSEQLFKWQENNKKIIFIIGGAYGFDKSIYARANESISFSEMTFSHQVIRLMFMEQLYRAFTIKHRLPYHHE